MLTSHAVALHLQEIQELVSPHIESFNFMLEEGLSAAAQVLYSILNTVIVALLDLILVHIFSSGKGEGQNV